MPAIAHENKILGNTNTLNDLTDVNLTSPQNGQVPIYNSTTQKWENGNQSGGGGLLPHFYIDSESGSTVTVTAPDGSIITPTQISSGHWECDVPSYGVYTIHAVLNGDDATVTVTVDDVKEYHITDNHYSYTLSVYAPTGSTIRVFASGETYTGTGAGSTAVVFGLHQASTTYAITNTIDGLSKTDSVTTPSTTGGSGSRVIQWAIINVTYDNDFKGVSITCTQGGTTITKTAPSGGNTMVFYPPTTGSWVISGTVGGSPYSVTANVASLSTPVSVTLETIPDGKTITPTDDISIWLACGQITGKSYTTLSQVLADTETYERLLSDSNACDYMARSTTWSSTICADADAMMRLGKYDYACDALLADSTWCTAICGSTYHNYVFDVYVPKMTSNSAPSGTVSASAQYSSTSYAYLAFDGDSTTGWTSGATTTGWLEYDFPNEVDVDYVAINTDISALRTQTMIAQAYINGAWANILDSTFNISSTDGLKVFPCNARIKATRFRMNISASTDTWTFINTLQFYGRHTAQTDIIVTAHGGDTVYYMDNGSPVTLTTADSDTGIGTVDWSDLPKGAITLYSSTAKNPSDLTADYSKTVYVTEYTTQIYLMPDNALYWWGHMSSDAEETKPANGWTLFSGYTFVAPTYSTDKLTMTTAAISGGNTQCGIGSKNIVNNATRLCTITQGKTMAGTRYGELFSAANKTLVDDTELTNSAIAKSQKTISGSSYVAVMTNAARSIDVYALWYE